ncbi:MAG: DUF4738 domain-containing protein [Prevotella sp.]|nr:DUF4738 domain-containing protein [Prevotella sp.]
MNISFRHIIIIVSLLCMALMGCTQQRNGYSGEESKEAKQLLQGVWSDEETETVVFQMKGDSVYYPDTTSMPAYFKVVGDTLYISATGAYHIEKHTEHLLWFKTKSGEIMKLVKTDDESLEEEMEQQRPQVLTVTDVLKSDTVVFWEGRRYHLYVTINPTKYKVVRHTTNDEGLDVENVYYDNIINLAIFQGKTRVYSSDLRKQRYEKLLPEGFINQSVLNNMEYEKTDAQGFHFNMSICIPGESSCYLVEHVVSFDGKVSTQLNGM